MPTPANDSEELENLGSNVPFEACRSMSGVLALPPAQA